MLCITGSFSATDSIRDTYKSVQLDVLNACISYLRWLIPDKKGKKLDV